jgi:DAK2 domain fusion protein YloV
MSPAPTLGAARLRRVLVTFAQLLRSHREVINRLNVYPVPDGDTGTNMTLTLESVVEALEPLGEEPAMADLCQAVAHGSLMGARGNSGVILSQLLRGLAERFREVETVDAERLVAALEHADHSARAAVVRPVEGTILSVARGAAEGAAKEAHDLVGAARAARDAARVALAHTPAQLEVLARAGVVDAGGSGLVLLFDALCHELAGDALPEAPPASEVSVHVEVASTGADAEPGGPRYEVMYLLEAEEGTVSAFREVWAGLGDSIVIVGGDGLYNCHIHTDEIGAAIEAALDAGRPREIRVTDLNEQVLEERWVREASAVAPPEVELGPPPRTAVVAVVVGEGVGRILRSLGVRTLVAGGQSMNPSTADLVAAAQATGSPEVIILPNNTNIVGVARQVDDLVEAAVEVVPTSSLVEGFAALLAYDPDASAAENAAAMCESATHVRAGEVTQAVRDAETEVGAVHEGDWIGLAGGEVRSVADSLAVAANLLLASLVGPGSELVTVIEGEGSSAAVTRRITEFLAAEHPGVAVEVHHGGQPLYPYLFGVE